MKKMKKITEIVLKILETDIGARNSDSFLYFRVLEHVSNQNGMDIHTMPVARFLMHMNDWGFPKFESVRRARQKLQAKYPELGACDAVADQRMRNERIYRAYALEELK